MLSTCGFFNYGNTVYEINGEIVTPGVGVGDWGLGDGDMRIPYGLNGRAAPPADRQPELRYHVHMVRSIKGFLSAVSRITLI